MINLDHKRIVVTFLMHLGDVILTTPFLEVLRKAAPHSEITYVIDKKLSPIMEANPYIDHLVTVDKKGEHNSIGALWRMGRKIREEYKPHVVINLHPNERTSFLAFAIGAREMVGMSHFLFRPWMTGYTRLDRRNLHAADMYVDVLAQLGVPIVENQGLMIGLKDEWKVSAQEFYKMNGVSQDDVLIGFNVGSAVPEKRWPAERFAHVADYFQKKGDKAVFFGGPMDEEMVQSVCEAMTTKPIVATGKFDLGVLSAAVGRCQLFITNDSGPMHVAVSQKVPIVALYGPSNPKLYGPYTSNAIVLESMEEYDVEKNMKQVIKEGKYKGLSVIKEEAVIWAAKQLLQKQGFA